MRLSTVFKGISLTGRNCECIDFTELWREAFVRIDAGLCSCIDFTKLRRKAFVWIDAGLCWRIDFTKLRLKPPFGSIRSAGLPLAIQQCLLRLFLAYHPHLRRGKHFAEMR
jgi:hypothetical protein